jgi:hypothetical protein
MVALSKNLKIVFVTTISRIFAISHLESKVTLITNIHANLQIASVYYSSPNYGYRLKIKLCSLQNHIWGFIPKDR